MMACMTKAASSSGYSISGGVLIGSLRVGRGQFASPDGVAGHLYGFPVEAEAAGAERDDVKEPAGHHQVLVEVDHVVRISGRQMHAKGSAEADKDQQGSGPSRVETREQCQTAEEMHQYRDPDGDIGRRYVNAGEILRRAARITQLDNAIPHEKARHQQSCERQQKGFASHSAAPFRIWAMWMHLIGTPMRSAQPCWCIRQELSAETMYSAPAREWSVTLS